MTTVAHSSPQASAARSIFQINTAYFQSKVLQAAVELGLFDLLAEGALTSAAIRERLGLEEHLTADFLDALVLLGLLERTGDTYANSQAASDFLVTGAPAYLAGTIAQHARMHYHNWASLKDTLTGNKPKINAVSGTKEFQKHFENADNVRRLMLHMDTFNGFVAGELERLIDWDRRTSFLDLGGARGNVAAHLVRAFPHLRGHVFDLPPVKPFFDEHMAAQGTASKVDFTGGDFFRDTLPRADVVIIGHVLHDWPETTRRQLIERAFSAVTPGGLIAIYDAMLDDERSDLPGLLQSLNCGIMRDGGSEYTIAECRDYVEKAGFTFSSVHLLDTITNDRLVLATRNR